MTASNIIGDLLRHCFKPRVILSPSEWCEANIRLDAKTSNIAGRYSLRHTPYLRAIYDDIANPRIRKIVVKKAAQLGLTQFANNLLLYYVCNFAYPLLMVMPSKEAAQQFCERSLIPSIYNSTEVKKYTTGSPDDIKKTEMLFTSCILRVIGAGSPSKLASNPAAVVIVDEVDKGEDFANIGEAPALELAEDRTLSFPNDKKIVVLSTPTEEARSVIHGQYLLGSQCQYFVSCTHCHHEQVLKFSGIKWPGTDKSLDGEWDVDAVERHAYYECEACHTHLVEQDKLTMVRGGNWKPTNPKTYAAEVRSYHISSLYSFNVTFGALAKLFLLSKDDSGKLRNFYNSYLGECYTQFSTTVKEADLNELIKASPLYSKGQLLKKPAVILVGGDVQIDSLWFATMAFYSDGSSSLLDYGQLEEFADLDEVIKRRYPVINSSTPEFYTPFKGVIDAGYANRKTEVYEYCINSGFRFIPIMGQGKQVQPVRVKTISYNTYSMPLLLIDDGIWKNELYIRRIKQRQGKMYLPANAAGDEILKTHLTAERYDAEKKSWVTVNRDNHIADCMKYAIAFKSQLEDQIQAAAKAEAEPIKPVAVAAPVMQYQQPTYAGNGWD